MHASRLDGTDRLDGACQLALEATLVVDLFGKLADPEFLVFHQFEADHAAAGQSLRSKLEPHFVHTVSGNLQRATVSVTMCDVLLFEDGDDGATILFGQVREQRLPIRLSTPEYRANDDGKNCSHRDHEDKFLLAVEPVEGVAQTLHRVSGRCCSCCRLSGCCHQ